MADIITIPFGEVDNPLTISSNGDVLSLVFAHERKLICSISDQHGRLVRHVNRWLRYLCNAIGKSITASTVNQYARSTKYLCDWIEQSERYPSLTLDEAIEILDRQDITDWQDYQQRKGSCSNSTLHSREAAIKGLLTWLTSKEGGNVRHFDNSPWGRDNSLDYTVKKGNKKTPKVITPDHIIRLLNSMHNECERCMFHLQYDTGLRISELINLKRADLPLESIYKNESYEFIPFYIRGAKGRATGEKERTTIISRAVLNRVRKYHSSPAYNLAEAWKINDPNKPMFLTSNQSRWTARNASKQFSKAVKRSNVGADFSTHWMRHGTAFSVLNSDIGKDYEDKMLAIQSMLGHSSLATTEIYTQISPALLKRLNKAGNNLNRLDEAEYIRKSTYLPPLQHRERRGHHIE